LNIVVPDPGFIQLVPYYHHTSVANHIFYVEVHLWVKSTSCGRFLWFMVFLSDVALAKTDGFWFSLPAAA
jgi:hypothetical protein